VRTWARAPRVKGELSGRDSNEEAARVQECSHLPVIRQLIKCTHSLAEYVNDRHCIILPRQGLHLSLLLQRPSVATKN
jgi:hypothetical protein